MAGQMMAWRFNKSMMVVRLQMNRLMPWLRPTSTGLGMASVGIWCLLRATNRKSS